MIVGPSFHRVLRELPKRRVQREGHALVRGLGGRCHRVEGAGGESSPPVPQGWPWAHNYESVAGSYSGL